MRRYIKIIALLCAVSLALLTACSSKELEKQIDELNAEIEILEQEKKELEEEITELNGETVNFPNIKGIVEQEKNNILKSINLFIASLDDAHNLLDYTYDFEYKKLNQRYSLIIYEGDCPYGLCKLYDNVTNEVKKIDIPRSDNNSLTTANIPNESPEQIVFFSNGINQTGAGNFHGFSRKFIYNINTEEIDIINISLHDTSYHNWELGLYTNEMEFDEVIVNENSFSINFKENENTNNIGPFNYPTIYISTEKPENQKGYLSFIFQNVLLQKDTVQKFDKLKQLDQIKDVEVLAYDDNMKIKGTKVFIYLNDGVEYYGDFIDVYDPLMNIFFN